MFLLEGGSKTIDSSVAVEEERAGVVGERVSVRVGQNRWDREFLEEFPHDGLHGQCKNEFHSLIQERVVMDQILLATSARNFLW